MIPAYFVYREPESIDELKSLLLLRYSVYRQSRLKHLAPENKYMINMDSHDLNAKHFGLYEHIDGSSRPVGYIRMVTDGAGPWANEIQQIVHSLPELTIESNTNLAEPLPLMEYVPDIEALRKLYVGCKRKGEHLVEPGRLSLDHSVRSLGISGHVRTSSNMVASTFAAFMVDGVSKAVLTASLTHKGFYEQFGFTRTPGVSDWFWEDAGENRCCLIGSPESLPEPMKEKVLRMAEAWSNTRRICFHPSANEQFFAPTHSYISSRPALRAA
ncbi:MAG: hypothetical protein ACKVRP_05465 [Bacteroidota bacterium]